MSSRRRKRSGKAQAPADDAFWGAEDHPEVAPKVVPGKDPTAMLRSLGPLPLPVHEDLANAQLAAVYRNAARVATAVAAAAGLVDLEALANGE